MTKRLNILFIIDGMDFALGGTERHLLQVVTLLNKSRFKCFVYTLFEGDPRVLQELAAAGCEVHNLELHRIYDLQALKKALRLYKFIRQSSIDIVQTFHFGADTYGALTAKLARVPIVISSRRDIGYYRTGHRLLASRFSTKLDAWMIAVCDAVKKQIVRDEKVAPEKIRTIYNGVDLASLRELEPAKKTKLRSELGIPPNAFVVGSVAHFRPEKGYQYFFEAARKIRPMVSALKVLCVGVIPPERTEKMVRDEANLGEDVLLPGYVKNVTDYLSIMDVACLTPYANEGFSNALLEQMALGRAVVATDVGGNAEAIEHGVSGFIVPPRDANAMAEALLRLYRDPSLRQAMGMQARARVEKHFTISKMINELEQFYLSSFYGRLQ